MLDSIRNAAQGVVGKAIMTVVMGLIIVSFVIWGVGDMLRGFSPSTVASVGGAKISAQEYKVAYDRAIQQYQRRLRHPFTNEEAAPDRPRPAAFCSNCSAKRRSTTRRASSASAFPRTRCAGHHLEPEFPATSPAHSTRSASPALCATRT